MGRRGAISQGRTRPEARENVIDALRLVLRPEPDQTADPDREPLFLPPGVLKRRALERHLREHGAEVLNEGAKHTTWRGPTIVPRHNEIGPGVAIAICKQLGLPMPPNPR